MQFQPCHTFLCGEHITKYQGKLMSSPLYKYFLSACIENANMKLMTLYRRSNSINVLCDFVSTILLYECLIKKACKSNFIIDFESTYNLRLNKDQCLIFFSLS